MSNDWQLALEQTTDLQVAHGSMAAVAAAVRRGADLRLYMTTATYEETLYFQLSWFSLIWKKRLVELAGKGPGLRSPLPLYSSW